MKNYSPHSFTDASVPKKKGSAGPVQERRESKRCAKSDDCRASMHGFSRECSLEGVI